MKHKRSHHEAFPPEPPYKCRKHRDTYSPHSPPYEPPPRDGKHKESYKSASQKCKKEKKKHLKSPEPSCSFVRNSRTDMSHSSKIRYAFLIFE